MFSRDRFSTYIERLKRFGRFLRPSRPMPIRRARTQLTCEILETRLAPASGLSLTDPAGLATDRFGAAIAVSNQYILVGAPGAPGDTGTAYVYSNTGALLQTLKGANPSDNFGTSVAISGDNVLIGAPSDTGGDGTAYLFSAASGALLQTYVESTRSVDQFGTAVAIDGSNVVIGTPGFTTNTGVAYLFNTSGTATQQTYTLASLAVGDKFGSAVAISGNEVLVGAPGTSAGSGKAYMFRMAEGTRIQTYNDPVTPAAADGFGGAVALQSGNAVIGADKTSAGAGAAYLFTDASNLAAVTFADPTVTPAGNFGHAVAIAGNEVLVGAPKDNPVLAGAAYLYSASGTLLQKLTDPGQLATDAFGFDVGLSASQLIVGAPGALTGGGAFGTASAASLTASQGNNQSVQVTTSFGTLAALVTDANGNPVAGAQVTFTEVNGANGAGATFANQTPVVTNALGIATAPALTANKIAGSFTVVATLGGLSTTYQLTNTSGPASTLSAFVGDGSSAVVGNVFGTALEAQVTDALGNPVVGAAVTFTEVDGATGAGATFPGATPTTVTVDTNAQGLAIAPQLTANGSAGGFTVTATALAGTLSTVFTLSNTSTAAAHVLAIAGTPQSAALGTGYVIPLQAEVVDVLGNPVVGALVTFAAPGAGASGSFGAGATVATNILGIATAPALTANNVLGGFTVTATVLALPAANFSLTNVAGAPAQVAITGGNNQSRNINTSNAFNSLSVSVQDAFGNAVPAAPTVFTIVGGSGAAGATFAGGGSTVTVNTDVTGAASTPRLSSNGFVGSFTVVASVGGLSATFTLTNIDPPASIVAFAGANQSAEINTTYATPLEAEVLDSAGIPLGNVLVTFAVTAGAGGQSATLTSTTSVLTNSQGIATASALTANGRLGAFAASASVAGVGAAASFALTNVVGAPAAIGIQVGSNQTRTVGGTFGTMTVLVTDSFNNPVPNAAVTFSVLAGYTGAGATFPGGPNPISQISVNTATDGTASIANAPATTLSANGFTGAFSVLASVSSVSTTFVLNNTFGPVAALTAIAGGNQSATVGTAFGNQLQVLVTDAFGNPVVGQSVTFTAPNTTAGTFSVNTNARGIATAPVLTANSSAGTFTATASAGGFSASFPLTNLASTASSITPFAGTPQSAPVNTTYTTALQARVLDTSGNPVANVQVTFAVPTSGPSALFSGATTFSVFTNAQGIATAPALTANTTPGSFQATASVAGVAAPATFDLQNTASAIVITPTAGGNQSATVNTAFANRLQATVTDSNGNPVANQTVTFTAPVTAGNASVTFAGTNTNTTTATTNGQGVAIASVMTADTVAGTFNVTASTAGVNAVFSLTNLAGTAASIQATSGTPQSTTIGTAFATPLQARVFDSFNNPVPNVQVTFAVPANGASGVFSGSAVALTNAQGIATAPTLTANTTPGSFQATATAAGVATSATYNLTSTASALVVTPLTGNNQSATVNSAFANQLQATVTDSNGNPVANQVVTFTAPGTVGNASATFAGGTNTTTATTNAQGVAITPALTADTIAGTFTVIASVSGGTSGNFTLTNLAGTATTVQPIAGSNQSTTIGTAFATPLQARVFDSFNNPVPNVQVTFAVPANGASGVFSGSSVVLTNAQGIATAPTLTANTTPGSFQATATAAGVATSATYNLTSTASALVVTPLTGNNQSATVNTTFANQLQATITDSNGNPVANQVVTFTAPSSGASATFAGGTNTTTATTNAQGVAITLALTADTIAGTFTVIASVSGGTSGNYTLTNLAGNAASIQAVSGATQSTTVGTPFGALLQARVFDTFSNPVPNVQVTFAVPAAGASGVFTGSAVVFTNAQGMATAPVLTANTTPGTFQATATAAGAATPATYSLTNTATALVLTPIAGNNQSTVVNTKFANQLQVSVTDGNGNPVANQLVTFTAPPTASGASGTFASTGTNTATATSNAQGIAIASVFTADGIAGNFSVHASMSGSPDAVFALTNVASAPNTGLTTVSGNLQSVPVNSNYAKLVVKLADAFGNPVGSNVVTFTAVPGVTNASAFFVGFGSQLTVATDPNGTADTSTVAALRANQIVGSFSVIATATVSGVTYAATFNLTNTLAAITPTNVVLTPIAGSNQSATVNTTFLNQVEARVTDFSGNPVPNQTVTFTAPNGQFVAGGTFTDPVTGQPTPVVNITTDGQGVAVAPFLQADKFAGNFTVIAKIAGGVTAVFSLSNTPDVPATLTALGGASQQALVGTTFGTALQAKLTDQFDNPLPNVAVKFGVASVHYQIVQASWSNNVATFTTQFEHGFTAGKTLVTISNMTPAAYNGTYTVLGVPDGADFTVQLNRPTDPGPSTTGGDAVITADSSVESFAASPIVFTNDQGIAVAPSVTAKTTSPPNTFYIVSATVNSPAVQPAQFNLTNIGPTTIYQVSGDGQATPIGTPFGRLLQAKVLDENGNPMANVPVTFAVSFIDEPLIAASWSASVVFTTALANGLKVGDTVAINNVTSTGPASFNGAYMVTSVINDTSFRATPLTDTSVTDRGTAIGFGAAMLNGGAVAVPITGAQWSPKATFTTEYGQGLNIGDTVTISHVSSTGVGTFNGKWVVTGVVNGNQFDATPATGFDPTANRGIAIGLGDALVPVPAVSAATADVPIIAASWAPQGPGTAVGTATFTTKFTTTIAVGDTVVVNNMAPLGYNGIFVVASVTANQFNVKSVNNPRSNIATGFGDVQVPVLSGNSEQFASSPTVLTNAQGIATAPVVTANFVVSPPGATFVATASIDGTDRDIVTPANFSLINTGVPYQVTLATDVPASLSSEANAFHFVLPVLVTDFYGRPVPNATLTYNVVALNTLSAPKNNTPAGSFNGASSITVHTDLNGEALLTTLARNPIMGKFGVDVYAAGDPIPYMFTLNNTNVPPNTVAVDPPTAVATVAMPFLQSANASFQQQFAALVTDASANPLSGVTVIFSAPNPIAPNAQVPPSTAGASFQGTEATSANGQSFITETTGRNGVATVPVTNGLVANTTAGQFAMTVAPVTSVPLSAASWSPLPKGATGGTLTFTSQVAAAVQVGQTVWIGGVTSSGPASYNGLYTVTSVRGNQFTVGSAAKPLPNPGIANANVGTLYVPLKGYRANTIMLTNTPGIPDAAGVSAVVKQLPTSFGTLYDLKVTVADAYGNIIPNVAVGLTVNSPDGVFFSNNFDTTSAAVTNKNGVAIVPIQVVSGQRNRPFDLNLAIAVALPGGGSIAVQKIISGVIVK
jgi:protocatechuate 3,4-dioxygenase beta subunit